MRRGTCWSDTNMYACRYIGNSSRERDQVEGQVLDQTNHCTKVGNQHGDREGEIESIYGDRVGCCPAEDLQVTFAVASWAASYSCCCCRWMLRSRFSTCQDHPASQREREENEFNPHRCAHCEVQ